MKSKQKTYTIKVTAILVFWLFFWILPAYFLSPFASIFSGLEIINNITRIDLEGFVYYYMIIAPLLSFLPYKILKKILPDFHYNAVFFTTTVVIPIIFSLIYLFIYLPSMINIGGGFGV